MWVLTVIIILYVYYMICSLLNSGIVGSTPLSKSTNSQIVFATVAAVLKHRSKLLFSSLIRGRFSHLPVIGPGSRFLQVDGALGIFGPL